MERQFIVRVCRDRCKCTVDCSVWVLLLKQLIVRCKCALYTLKYCNVWVLLRQLKGVCHEIFDLYFFDDSNLSGPLINRLVYFRIWFRFRQDIRSQSLKNSTPQCAWHRGVKIFGSVNQINFLQIFSFMIYAFIKGFLLIVPLRATRDSQRFRFWLCGVQFDSAVWCTPRSLTDFAVQCTPRKFSEILISWLTEWSLSPQWDAQSGTWLCSGMHTSELFEKFLSLDSLVWCTPRSFLKIWISWRNRNWIRKYFSLFIRGLWVWIMEKIKVENLVTHSL